MIVEYEPALVEAAVLAAVAGHPDERAFRAERDPAYEVDEAEAREAAFAAIHARWFTRLHLDRPLQQVLGERPLIAARCGRCLVARAVAAPQEAADLGVAPPAAPTVLIRLRPETVAVPARALLLLRRELLHVADMLDPDFGYAPCLRSSGAAKWPSGPPTSAGPGLNPGPSRQPIPSRALTDGGLDPLVERAAVERYRALWDAYVDGRLARAGHAAPDARARCWSQFRRAFPGLGDQALDLFARFFDGPRATHADLVAFAISAAAASTAGERAPRSP